MSDPDAKLDARPSALLSNRQRESIDLGNGYNEKSRRRTFLSGIHKRNHRRHSIHHLNL